MISEAGQDDDHLRLDEIHSEPLFCRALRHHPRSGKREFSAIMQAIRVEAPLLHAQRAGRAPPPDGPGCVASA